MGGLYAHETVTQIVIVTGLIGGAAAWLAGQAIARTWRPFWHVGLYMVLLGAAVRFAHFALFRGDLLSLPSYAVDTLFLTACGLIAFRMTRARQMATQYPWLYRRTGPLTWRARSPAPRDEKSANPPS